ncbi:MAG TPA: SDR family oxidoreductase [Alphaproteobacteria bacterium]|nr:SDR family oxidoreductase [Alphaproteobacteria bacterium]
MSDRELAERVAIVTGSARNIGRSIALELAHAGASIVVNAKTSRAEADAVAREIEAAGGKAVVKLADVADPAGAKALVDAAVAAFGQLDIVVNNASVRRENALGDISYGEWREVLGIILDAAFLVVQAAMPHLVSSGNGAVINLGGLSAHIGSARRAHVVAAKAGLVGLTRALAHDLSPKGVTVNCVAPGTIDTVRAASSTSGGEPAHHAHNKPLVGRRGAPEEIASLIRYLAGPNARYITGQTIHANGGTFLP